MTRTSRRSRRSAALVACSVSLSLLAIGTACDERPDVTGALEGLTGTVASVSLSEAFIERLGTTPSGSDGLDDTDYAGNAYDAVVTIALATEAAGSDGISMASEIVGITGGGSKCTTFQRCRELVLQGGDPDYDGESGTAPLGAQGEPGEAIYEVRTMGANDRIDPARSFFVAASAPPEMSANEPRAEGTREGNGVLRIGVLVDLTQTTTIFTPAIRSGVELAVDEINAAGGVLGKPIEVSVVDSGDASTDRARRAAESLVAEGVDAIVGPSTSAVTLEVLDIVTSAGVVLFSPSNTATILSTLPDRGLYFRNIASDLLQAEALAQLIADRGNNSAFLLVIDDPYGLGVADQLTIALARREVAVVGSIAYDPDRETFFDLARRVRDADPDAVVLTSFGEASLLLRALVATGVGPRQKQVFGTDAGVTNAIGERFDAGV